MSESSTEAPIKTVTEDLKEGMLADEAVQAVGSVADIIVLGGRRADIFGSISGTNRAYIGGLEEEPQANEEIKIDGLTYVAGQRFRAAIRGALLDWRAFIDYQPNATEDELFQQVAEQLNIKSAAKEHMLPLLEQIYQMTDVQHVTCMMRQYRVIEPFSTAVFGLYGCVKRHMEYLIRQYYEARAAFLRGKKNLAEDDGQIEFPTTMAVEWSTIEERAAEINEQHQLDSSSPILLLINPPESLPRIIDFIIHTTDAVILEKSRALQAAINQFHYQGFCPKRPIARLVALSDFPMGALVDILLYINPKIKLPDYDQLITIINRRNTLERPMHEQEIKRHKCPAGLDDKAQVIWYVDEIMRIRKELVPLGQQYEKYYIRAARDVIDRQEKICAALDE